MFIITKCCINNVFRNNLFNVQDDEMYWPDENASLTIDHTTVTNKGSEVKGATTILKLETKRFKQVTAGIRVCLISGFDTHFLLMC